MSRKTKGKFNVKIVSIRENDTFKDCDDATVEWTFTPFKGSGQEGNLEYELNIQNASEEFSDKNGNDVHKMDYSLRINGVVQANATMKRKLKKMNPVEIERLCLHIGGSSFFNEKTILPLAKRDIRDEVDKLMGDLMKIFDSHRILSPGGATMFLLAFFNKYCSGRSFDKFDKEFDLEMLEDIQKRAKNYSELLEQDIDKKLAGKNLKDSVQDE